MKDPKQRVSVDRGAKFLLYGFGLLGLCLSIAAANAAQRPIADFLSAQGTYVMVLDDEGNIDCAASHYRQPGETDPGFQWVPPQPNIGGWADPKAGIFLLVDYPGLADALMGGAFGTRMGGSITEVPLADGRAEVSVILHTRNALIWASDWTIEFPGPVVFGHTLQEVMDGATPALGDSLFQLKFRNTAPGAPLPDLQQLTFCPQPGQEILFDSCQARASGPLPDGTPGRLEMRQTGLIALQMVVNPNSRVALDAFPAEKIVIQPVGNWTRSLPIRSSPRR